jgi:thioredoxin-dependent peroxiredoxin
MFSAMRKSELRPITRSVYVVDPVKKIKLILVYPMTTGRNFDEVLRAIDSLQLTAKSLIGRENPHSETVEIIPPYVH